MDNSNFTPEFLEKAKGKTAEELIALAQGEGIELSDEQLKAIAGGGWNGHHCDRCGSWDVSFFVHGEGYRCNECGYSWQ